MDPVVKPRDDGGLGGALGGALDGGQATVHGAGIPRDDGTQVMG